MWTLEAYQAFLEYRRTALAQAINDLITPHTSSAYDIDIQKIIGAGESESVEFKAAARWDYRAGTANKALETVICKTIAGLSNGKGGSLLVGVDDSGAIVGLELRLSPRLTQTVKTQFAVR
jgi:predicted HTH transcriptional regulator